MRIHDKEDLLEAVRDFLQANFNTKLSEINTEKGDYTIDAITADDAHFLISQKMREIPNAASVIIGTTGPIPITYNYGNTSMIVPLELAVLFADPHTTEAATIADRYARALYETIAEFQDAQQEVTDLRINQLSPTEILIDARKLIKAAISVEVPIG
jgi:hypothetical protein